MSKQPKAKLFSLRCLLMDFVRLTGALPGLVWLRPKRRYTSKQAKKRIRGAALVIANHTGFLDPAFTMLALWYRRQYFVCHQAIIESKAGPLLRAAGCLIPIDADNFGVGSLRAVTGCLNEGKVVVIFPEGHINGGQMLQFRSGVVLMAMQGHCPVVPLYIKPRRHWYSRLEVTVDEPVDVAALCEGKPAFTKMKEITQLLQDREAYLEQLANHNTPTEELL